MTGFYVKRNTGLKWDNPLRYSPQNSLKNCLLSFQPSHISVYQFPKFSQSTIPPSHAHRHTQLFRSPHHMHIDTQSYSDPPTTCTWPHTVIPITPPHAHRHTKSFRSPHHMHIDTHSYSDPPTTCT